MSKRERERVGGGREGGREQVRERARAGERESENRRAREGEREKMANLFKLMYLCVFTRAYVRVWAFECV